MNSHEIRLASKEDLLKEKENITGYIKDWNDILEEIEEELRKRKKDYSCY